MKKYALIGSWGTWEQQNGKTIISCTVKGHYLIDENDDYFALKEQPSIEYRPDGTWHFSRIEKRVSARQILRLGRWAENK